MSETSKSASPKTPPATGAGRMDITQVENLLRCLGQAVSSMSIYGPQHKVTQVAVDEGFALLNQVLAHQPAVSLGVAEDRLLCDEHLIEAQNALLRTLLRRLTAMGVNSFEIRQGIKRDEFGRLMVVLGTASGSEAGPGDALAKAVRNGGFEHFHLKRMSYQVVAEDDVIIKKGAAEQLAATPVEVKPPSTSAVATEIVAFLQGKSGEGGVSASGEAKEIASHPDKLAELVLRAAEIRPETAQVAGGETLGNMVVGCLRRLHDQMLSSPSCKTKQGKRELSRALVLLEREVVEQLHHLAGEEAAEAAGATIKAAVDDLVSDVRMDALAADYLKKHQQAVSTEQQLAAFIANRQGKPERAAELQDLHDKLTQGGLDAAGWDLLMLKSAGAVERPGGGAGSGGPPLAMLLMQLTDLLDPAKRRENVPPPREELAPVVSQLNYGVTRAIAGVAQKMGDLREKIKNVQSLSEEAKVEDVHKQALLRKDLIAMLAEIVQEIRQPMSVIISVVDMLNTGCLGTVPDVQRDMLTLAQQNGRRLCAIVDTLAGISGMPATLQPDAKILERIYKP